MKNNKYYVVLDSKANVICILKQDGFIEAPLNQALREHFDEDVEGLKIGTPDMSYNMSCNATIDGDNHEFTLIPAYLYQ